MKRNLVITGAVGFFTGGLAGAIASPIVFHQYHQRLKNTPLRWLAWAGTGLIVAPLLLGMQAAILDIQNLQPANQSELPSRVVPSVAETTNSAANPSTSSQSTQLFKAGDVVTAGDRSITVGQVTTSNGLKADNPFAEAIDGQIVLVYFTLTNSGSESGNVLFSSFQLSDQQGRRYDEISDLSYSLWRDEQSLKSRSDDLYPGESRSDVAAFRIAPDASGFTLDWKGQHIQLDTAP
jgi:hypothetical protein